MAAALSYRTIFGLLPMIVVALVVLKAFSTDQEIEHLLNRSLTYAGLNTIGVGTDAAEALGIEPPEQETTRSDQPTHAPHASEGATPAESTANAGTGDESAFFAESEAPPDGSLAYAVKVLVARASSINVRAIGFIGGIMLIYAAISMLVEIERAFNQIYRVPAGKSWIRRIFQYWTMLTLGTLLLFISFYIGEQFKAWVERVADAGGIDRNNMIWLMVSGYGITVVVSTLLILLVYLAVPNTRVRFVPALAGALVAAVLWEAGKWGFTQYLSYSSSYAQLYGSIALIPLFLLWVYVTWFIVLLGLNISYHLQQARAGTSLALPGGQVIGWEEMDAEPGVVDPTAALALLEVIATGFRDGTPVSQRRLAQKTGLTTGTTQLLLDRLSDRGFVHRVADASGAVPMPGVPAGESAMYALARPPELIAAADVLRVGYELSGMQAAQTATIAGVAEGVSPLPSTLVERLRRAQLEAAGQSSLASLMAIQPGGEEHGPRSAGGEGESGWTEHGANGRKIVVDSHSIPRSLDSLPNQAGSEAKPRADSAGDA